MSTDSDSKGIEKFFRPITYSEDWKQLLAKPHKHWKTGYSAKALAYCWQEARGFPSEVSRVFRKSGIAVFEDIEILVAFPEYKVPLPGGPRASQSDVFILAKGNGQLVCIMVEGKASEPFGETIAKWKVRPGEGKEPRLKYLCELLELNALKVIDVRYQLMHRTASALIEAKRFNAPNALMLVHSFSPENEWFEDYEKFLSLFGVIGEVDSLVFAKTTGGVKLYFGWVRGDTQYLSR